MTRSEVTIKSFNLTVICTAVIGKCSQQQLDRVLKLAEYWSLYVFMHNTNTTEPGRAENSVEGIPSRVMGPLCRSMPHWQAALCKLFCLASLFVFPSCKKKKRCGEFDIESFRLTIFVKDRAENQKVRSKVTQGASSVSLPTVSVSLPESNKSKCGRWEK